MGQIRDFDQMVPGESLQSLTIENTTLKHRVLQERREGARSNLRFSEKRIAALVADLLELGSRRPGPAPDGLTESVLGSQPVNTASGHSKSVAAAVEPEGDGRIASKP